MGQQYSISAVGDGEHVQEAAGKGLLSMGGDKRVRVLSTVTPLTNSQVQCIGSMQQFIDEATTLSKTCIDKLIFTDKSSKARYEQKYMEAAA